MGDAVSMAVADGVDELLHREDASQRCAVKVVLFIAQVHQP